MKTLVTGATGFIGSNLVKLLGNESFYYLTNNRSLPEQYVNQLKGKLGQDDTMERIYNEKFERLIHLAWEGLPERNSTMNAKNLNYSKNIIKTVISSNRNCEINITGSCFEYGEISGNVRENQVPQNVNEFGKAKLDLLRYVKKQTDNYRWFRLFFVYGPNQHQNSLINFVNKKLREGSEVILDRPDICNDYIYVGDAVEIMWKLIKINECKGIINIGTGMLKSNLEVLNIIKQIYGSSSITQRDAGTAQRIGLKANIEKVKRFIPDLKFIRLEEGVHYTIGMKS
jgi:nucleoside-diphosphate-sugar epimerase